MNYLRFLQVIKLPVMFCHLTILHPVTTSTSVFKVRYLNPNIIFHELVGVVGERKKQIDALNSSRCFYWTINSDGCVEQQLLTKILFVLFVSLLLLIIVHVYFLC